eukprot:s785_g25.t1
MPTESEPGLPGRQGGGGEQHENVPSLGREMDTTEGNLRDNRRVNFRDTAMGSKEPDGNVQDRNQGKDKRKSMGDETLEKALGEQMYQEAVLEKEKFAKENERLHAEIQRLRAATSSASTTSSWVEVDKAPTTPKRGSSAAPKHTPGGTRIPIGPPPEDDEVFVTPPLPPVPPFPEFEEAHAGGSGWGVMWKPVPRATELGPAWPKGYWEVPFHRRSDVRPDSQGVQHRLQAAHQEINQRHQGDRYEVEIRQVLEGQDSNTQANVLAALAPMELHEKLAVVEVLGSTPMSLKTNLLMQGNDMSLWDRIAMFHGCAKRHQRGLDVVQELHERPGIAGLPVLDWMPHKAPPAPGQCAGDRASIHDHLRGDRASSQGHPQGDRASIHGHLGGDRASIPEHLAGDRASISGHLGGDRASIPGQHGGDRASISGHPGGDRAGIQGHLGGDRAGTPGHLGGYQPGFQGHLGGDQMGNRAHLHGDRAFPDVNINNQEVWDGDQFRSQRADYGQRDDGAGRDQRRRSRSPQEALRSTNPTMPKLPAPSSKNASVEVTDWLAEIRPLIGDLSTRASSWWDRTMQETMHTYQKWLAYTPLERLRLAAPQPNLEHLGHPQEAVHNKDNKENKTDFASTGERQMDVGMGHNASLLMGLYQKMVLSAAGIAVPLVIESLIVRLWQMAMCSLRRRLGGCWHCSAPGHRKPDCPALANGNVQSPAKTGGSQPPGGGQNQSPGGNGGGKKGGKGQQKGTTSPPSTPSRDGNGGSGQQKGDGSNSKGKKGGGKGDKSSPSTSTSTPTKEESQVKKLDTSTAENLLTEVSTLIKTIKTEGNKDAAQLKVISLKRLEHDPDGAVLLDSGATHCLRQPRSEREWETAVDTQVQTATGTSWIKQTPAGTTLLAKDVQALIPIGLLARMGVTMVWQRDDVHLRHPRWGKIPVSIKQNCPYISQQWGEKLMTEVEKDMSKQQLCALHLGLPDDAVMVSKDELQRWFPEAPADQINKLVVPKAFNAHEIPFNRHFRKRIQKATAVVLNLFCGPNPEWWEKKMPQGVEIINIDLLGGQDLLHDGLFSYLLQVAREKRILAYLAGPPCRTVSVLRMRDDNGPRMLRTRNGEHRWGLPNLKPWEQQQVWSDSQLWLRTLVLAKVSRHYNPRMLSMFEQPADPATYMKDLPEEPPTFSTWPELVDTLEGSLALDKVLLDQGALGHARR